MLMTKRKPATVGEILIEEFLRPMGLTQAALAVVILFLWLMMRLVRHFFRGRPQSKIQN